MSSFTTISVERLKLLAGIQIIFKTKQEASQMLELFHKQHRSTKNRFKKIKNEIIKQP
jgi:hypothetical protein